MIARRLSILGSIFALLRSNRGTVSIEYALIASLVSVAILGGIEALSGALTSLYESIGNDVANATSAGGSDTSPDE